MARVRIVHWKAAEAGPLIETCRGCGIEVEYDDFQFADLTRAVRGNPPDAFVIDLSCVPARGRDTALALRRTKYARHIPIVFVDGEDEKIDAIRRQLPDVAFATSSDRKQLCSRIRSACATPVSDPVVPPGPMESYRSRSTAQKLGIREGSTVALIDPPRDYASVLGEFPADVELIEDPDSVQPVTLWFIRELGSYQANVRRMRALAGRTKLWILWPKGNRVGLTQYQVRQTANEAGLVDYKICAVNNQWSGMAFARRKS